MKYIFVTENKDESGLAYSYKRALEKLGSTPTFFFISESINKNKLLPFAPKFINNLIFNHFEPKSTIHKVNVELTKFILINNIDVVFCFTNTIINPSTIVYLRSLGKKVILIYPDAIINLQLRHSSSISCYDFIFSYSETAIEAFKHLGAKNVIFCPLAGDDDLHSIEPKDNDQFLYDISFIGNYRPEREEVLLFIIKNFPNLKLKINGNWKKAKSQELKKLAENLPLYGNDYAKFINNSFISLNIIDHSNFPAANMRFFEIPTAGGFQLCSSCPEMNNTFIDGEHLLYFKNLEDLVEKINYCLVERNNIKKIRILGHQLLLSQHLYVNRLITLLDLIQH